MQPTNNAFIAQKLREMADLLEAQDADGFRVGAYRRAGDTVDRLAEPLEKIFAEKGQEGLIALPAIGRGISSAIMETVSYTHLRAHETSRAIAYAVFCV